MFSYLVAGLALLLFCYNPIIRLLSPGQPRVRRTPRPKIDETLLALEEPDAAKTLHCPEDSYSLHIVSKAPLVLYIENFISPEERAHLLEIAEPLYEPSEINRDGAGSMKRDAAVRDSEVAMVPRTDTVRCIEARARALQGWRDELWIERLRVQRYGPKGHYSHHFDWGLSYGGWGRVSSFMVWVDDSGGRLQGGGTEFPLLSVPSNDTRWCRFVECGNSSGKTNDGDEGSDGHGATEQDAKASGGGEAASGIVFKPLAGNAAYWENFRPDDTGRGYDETWHAALPVVKGTKVGLNIWTWGRID